MSSDELQRAMLQRQNNSLSESYSRRAVAKGRVGRVLARPTLCRLDGDCSEQVGAASRGWARFSVQGGSMASTSDELTDFFSGQTTPAAIICLS